MLSAVFIFIFYSMKLVSYFVVYSVLWSCLVCVPVLCPESPWLLFYSSKYQALAAAPKTWLSYWTGFTTAQSIKLWLLQLLPDLQWSHWLVLLYLLCSPAKLCPGLTLTILLFSSRLPFPTIWTLTSALLISVLSINITPLIILHLGLSLVNWCDKTVTILVQVWICV